MGPGLAGFAARRLALAYLHYAASLAQPLCGDGEADHLK